MFWIIAVAMVILASLAVIWPQRKATNVSADSDARFESLRAELKEIDDQKNERFADPREADAARAEVARRLFALEKEKGRDSSTEVRSFSSIAYLFVIIPAFAVPIYLTIGAPEYPDQRIASRVEVKGNGGDEFEALLARVESRLADEPNDVRGWSVIAPVYFRLGRFDDAFNAYAQTAKLAQNDTDRADAFANQGEVLVGEAEGNVSDEAVALFNQAIALNADQQKALFFMAIYTEQAAAPDIAIANWQELIARFADDNPSWLAVARQRLAGLGGEAPQNNPAPEPQFSAEELTMIEGMVSGLAARLAETPDDAAGWANLMRSYMVLKRNDDAVDALRKARDQFVAGSENRVMIEQNALSLGIVDNNEQPAGE